MIKGAWIVPHPPLIIPNVGRGQEREIPKTVEAYRNMAEQVRDLSPDCLVVATPHTDAYADAFVVPSGSHGVGSFANFGAPEVQIPVAWDELFIESILQLSKEEGVPVVQAGRGELGLDHGLTIPLYFTQSAGLDVPVVRLSISGLSPSDHRALGRIVSRAAEACERSFVFIASGDLSHKLSESGPYGLSAEGPQFDERIRQAVRSGNPEAFFDFSEAFCRKAAECGMRPIQVMVGALDGSPYRSEVLSYEAPFGVGYMVAAFRLIDTVNPYVDLARRALEHYVCTGQTPALPETLPEAFTNEKGGAFVTLKIGEVLRGCIGTISPTQPTLGQEIVHNAISAGTEDPRFPPVREEELDALSYSVDVLSEPEPVASKDELDPKRYGIIVSHGGRRGLLLPNLPGVDTVDRQLDITLQKAGIRDKDSYRIERFSVTRHSE